MRAAAWGRRAAGPPLDVVVDASALLFALGAKDKGGASLRAHLANRRVHAPHLIDAEVGNALRRQETSGRLSSGECLQILRTARAVVANRYPHVGPLSEMAWRGRHNLSFYDALYVALAVAIDAPLITADARIARVPKLPCRVELV